MQKTVMERIDGGDEGDRDVEREETGDLGAQVATEVEGPAGMRLVQVWRGTALGT